MAKNRDIITGIDLGTTTIKVVVAERKDDGSGIHLLGLASRKSSGLRKGFIISVEETTRALKEALKSAEKSAGGVSVKRAVISASGIGLSAQKTKSGAVAVSKADSEITDLDIARATEKCEENLGSALMNKKMLESFPVMVKVDGAPVFGRVSGMKGSKLEIETIFILCLSTHIADFVKAVENCGVVIDDIIPGPIASSLAAATSEEKEVGCAVLNIGSSTTSLIVFEEGSPLSLEVFPLGSARITYDLSVVLQITIEEAEQIKLSYGNQATGAAAKKLEDIVESRLTDIFDFAENHLKKINRSGLLPAGLILTGGGAALADLSNFAKNALRLPSKVGSFAARRENSIAITAVNGSIREQIINNPEWSTALGLCVSGLSETPQNASVFPRKIKQIFGKLLDSLTP